MDRNWARFVAAAALVGAAGCASMYGSAHWVEYRPIAHAERGEDGSATATGIPGGGVAVLPVQFGRVRKGWRPGVSGGGHLVGVEEAPDHPTVGVDATRLDLGVATTRLYLASLWREREVAVHDYSYVDSTPYTYYLQTATAGLQLSGSAMSLLFYDPCASSIPDIASVECPGGESESPSRWEAWGEAGGFVRVSYPGLRGSATIGFFGGGRLGTETGWETIARVELAFMIGVSAPGYRVAHE